MTDVVIVDAVRTPIGAFGGALASLPASHLGAQVIKALLERNPAPADEDIDRAMAGIVCRCGTYPRVRKGIRRAAESMSAAGEEERNG